MKPIDGHGRSVRELLQNKKYAIDFYQREYKWGRKQVAELLDDVTAQFMEDYEDGHDRAAVEDYSQYFLGSIIISDKDGRKYIIDGQQRLTTLTLLLVFLHNLQKERDDQVPMADLIFSERYAKKSFNLDVPERTDAMEALFSGQTLDDPGDNESVRNILDRYADIEDLFSPDLRNGALPFFIDWLVDNVRLVEITAYSDDDAYTIFETMNDRGLSLSPTDMLKGYLLANISDSALRDKASTGWRERTTELLELGKDEDADAIKSWLRSQYANSIRERRRGARPGDFDRLGTEFHRWVRDEKETIGLTNSQAYASFITGNMSFYARQYAMLRRASTTLTPGLERVFYNAECDFTLQYPVLLAPLRQTDTPEVVLRKLRVVATYIDILLTRRTWTWHSISYSTLQYAMYLVMRDIRALGISDLVTTLKKRLDDDQDTFESNDRFALHQRNGPQVHRILARMTAYLETKSGQPDHYVDYTSRGRGGYEVEHIWSDSFDRHTDEFGHPADFAEQRNRIGGLLLLPKKFNASYGALPYEQKLPHYLEHNLLAKSLHPQCYDHNPGFVSFVASSGLPFRPHPEFRQADLEARQKLLLHLAGAIWSPERLAEAAE